MYCVRTLPGNVGKTYGKFQEIRIEEILCSLFFLNIRKTILEKFSKTMHTIFSIIMFRINFINNNLQNYYIIGNVFYQLVLE